MSDDVILTQQECQAILNDMAARDPIMRLLMEKMAQAQREGQDKPMRVVGGAA